MQERTWPKSFRDRLTSPLPSNRDLLRIFREGGFRTKDDLKQAIPRIPRAPGLIGPVAAGDTALTWVGHATTLLRLGGLNILTDPVWSDFLPGRSRRLVPPGVSWENLPHIDAVVVSHNHYDHLDSRTIRKFPDTTHFFVPAGLARWFRRRGRTQVTELDWWQGGQLAGVRFDFVPAHHWSRRGIADTCATLWGGWVITAAGGERVYFAGDTGYGGWFKQIRERFPGIGLAVMPIGAYEPGWFMRSVHLDPAEALRALDDLGAKRMATMHWGTFVLSREPILEPLARIRQAWSATDRPREDLWDLAIGETRTFSSAGGEKPKETAAMSLK